MQYNPRESERELPARAQVLIVGGGPAGSTAATLLARQGVDVALIERDVFPRYHIGESLLPSCLEILDLLGAREKVEAYGFVRKPGAYLEWGGEKWSLDFGELSGAHTYSFQVSRAEFDDILLKHAASQGVRVFEGTQVEEILFEAGRPCAAICKQRGGGERTSEVRFDHIIDASGRASILSTRYLKHRRYHQAFQNVALWGYWTGARRPARSADGAINVGSVPGGWIWGIPLHDGTTSVGLVIHKDAFNAQKPATVADIYARAVAGCPLFQEILGGATLTSAVRIESDYSYTCERFSGPGYFIAGDAACFLDPLLSSGVHLATYSGLLAAASIASLIRGTIAEPDAIEFYEKSYRQAYLRFLIFVSTFYDQARGQEGYFREAQRLTQEDLDPKNLKSAFLNLVSGLEDLANAEQGIPDLVMAEMSARLRENLELRSDKHALPATRGQKVVADNVRFFDAVEGMSALSGKGVNGWRITTHPHLSLVRAETEET